MDFMGYDSFNMDNGMYDCQMYDQNQYQRKYNRSEVKQGLMDSVSQMGVCVSKVELIEEEPDRLRHACEPVGVSPLDVNIFPVWQPFGLVQVKYWCCKACGKLFISKFSLDSI